MYRGCPIHPVRTGLKIRFPVCSLRGLMDRLTRKTNPPIEYKYQQQECIPVGCVPPARYRTGGLCPGGGVSVRVGGLCPGGLPDRDPLPCEQNRRHV